MDDMYDALRLIAAKSEQAAREAMRLLRTPVNSPLQQSRYNLIAEWALSDMAAQFTPEERQLIASLVEPTEAEERAFMLRVRLTEGERQQLESAAQQSDLTMSEYARRKIFG